MNIAQVLNPPRNYIPSGTSNTHTKLLQLSPGIESVITRINTKDPKVLKKLMAMGILPGMPVKVIQKTPSIVFKVGNTTLAVDKDIASHIEIDNNM